MSSTEDSGVRDFFRSRLVPAARALRERGVDLLPRGAGEEASSWYSAPHDVPEFVELEADDLAERLRELWRAQGLPELAELAGPLLELAERLEVGEAESSDVSPFLYVMY